MPTYEYACKSCGQNLEVVQSFTDDPLSECPACGGQLRKVFGNVGIAFKGSGFYKNDSRSASKTSSSTTTKADPAETSKPSTETTTAAKDTSTSTTTAPSTPAKSD